MAWILQSKDIADILTENGFNTAELVENFLKNAFWNLRDKNE